MNKSLKKILVAGASLLMLASVGAATNLNNPVNARHRRTHRVYRHRSHRRTRRAYHRHTFRHYRYRTSLRHNAWLSGRYFGKKGYFSTNLYYWKHDKNAFKAGFIDSLRKSFHWGYPEANRSYNYAVKLSHHKKGFTVTNYKDGNDIYGWFVQYGY